MNDPFRAIQQLIDEKRAVYFTAGLASSNRGRCYVTVWGCPSDKVLCRGYGDTVMDAASDALGALATPAAPTLPGLALPGLTTR